VDVVAEQERQPGRGGVEHAEFRPLLANQMIELERMGVSADDFGWFLRYFVGHPFDYIEQQPTVPEWRLISKRRLTNASLIRHLRGDRVIGTGCRWDPTLGTKGRHVTPYVIIDLDLDGSLDDLVRHAALGQSQSVAWQDLLGRYDAVVRALGHPSVLLRSSESGGLHLYYLLAYPVELHALRDPESADGGVVRLLAAQGVPEKSGRVEVYPRGQYRRRGPQNRVRLPFGLGSAALDPFTLDRLTSGGPLNDLRHLAASMERGLVRLIEPEDWLEEANHLPPVSKRRPTSPRGRGSASRQRSPAACASAAADVQALWTSGLSGSGQFNEAVWSLGVDLRRRGMSADEARSKLAAWVDQKHNGCSRTYNTSRVEAYREIEEVVARLYSQAGYAGEWGPLPGLSRWEAMGLVEATRHDHQLADPTSGEVLSRFKVQQLGFELLRHGKQWLLREFRWRLADFVAAEPGLEPASAEFATGLAPMLSPFWPEVTRPEFIVPVPYTLRLTIEGIGKDSHWAHWRVLQHQEVYKLERQASATAHRAATYRIALDFGALSPNPVTLDSLPFALATLLEPAEIRGLYSRHYARRIRAASAQGLVLGPSDDLTATVIRMLLSPAPMTDNVPEAA
jgi:hypothetical protein